MSYTIKQATPDDHAELVKIAKNSKYTGAFSNRVMFSSDEAYQKGWIVKAVDNETGRIIGFYCIREKTRTPYVTLYFINVLPEFRSKFIGTFLLDFIKRNVYGGGYQGIELNVMKENEGAYRWYVRHGFHVSGEAMKGQAYKMKWERPELA